MRSQNCNHRRNWGIESLEHRRVFALDVLGSIANSAPVVEAAPIAETAPNVDANVVLDTTLSARQTGQGGAGKTIKELKDDGYSCERVGVNFIECTKKDAPDYWCDDAGQCQAKRLTQPGWPGGIVGDVLSGVVVDDLFGSTQQLRGDLNVDGIVDDKDIDFLCSDLRTTTSNPAFDLTGDGRLNGADKDELIENVLGTTYGDSNLDKSFNSSDMVKVFQIGEYEDAIHGNSGWADGDWNGDGDFDSGDLVLAFAQGDFLAAGADRALAG
jgi:hypothetical protein